jgi:hypothetical protein
VRTHARHHRLDGGDFIEVGEFAKDAPAFLADQTYSLTLACYGFELLRSQIVMRAASALHADPAQQKIAQ